MKNLNLVKIILIVIILIGVVCIFNFAFNKNVIKNPVDTIQIREENINEILQVYKDNFKMLGIIGSAFVSEHEENVNGIDIRRDYYVFGEDGKSLIKVKEFEGTNENGTPILTKEIYVDLSNKVEGKEYLYNGVTEIYVKDWTFKVLDNYEFKTPIEKISKILNNRYDFENNPKEIAIDTKNEIYAQKMLDGRLRIYGWTYGIKEEQQEDYFAFSIGNNERSLYLEFQEYENNKLIEKRTIQVSKQPGNIDDVTVPEL